MSTPLVTVTGLRADADGRTLVDGVSFTVERGQVVAVVGASGSGKSTTGRALLGEAGPGVRLTGRIEVAGRPVDPEHPPPAGTVGYVPQQPAAALNPVRRIGSVLREIARRHTAPAGGRRERRAAVRQAVDDVLRRVALPGDRGMLRRFPHQLSGGQQQRLVIAHALLARARVLVADEPTTGQDAVTRRDVADAIGSLAGTGLAIVLLTHDLDLVRAVADRVLVLRAGAVVEQGSVTGVLDTPRHAYTRRLVGRSDATRPPPAEAGVPLLRVHGLVAGHRPRSTVLHAVDLTVDTGRCLAVVGRSGSGKTTLARCVAGLHPPRTGQVLLAGRHLAARIDRRSIMDVTAVQYAFQDARGSFAPNRPVLDQVARTGVRLRGQHPDEARRHALALLDRMGLAAATVHRRPAGLSGGELQRAALARALLAEPRLLICDEITSGLDRDTQEQILALVDDHRQRQGLSLLVISHDRAVVARLADEVLVLDAGRTVERGPATLLLTAARTPLTRALLGVG